MARIRRLIRDLTDKRARQALSALAEEYEARAAELERQADEDPEGAFRLPQSACARGETRA